MPYSANYPATVVEVLDDGATFRPAALAAVRRLARLKPYRGSEAERLEKFRACLGELAVAYGIPGPALTHRPAAGGSSYYAPAAHAIALHGPLSVVTFLHEFAHARGFDERQACRWSINLFRRCFPRSYAGCQHRGHMLVRRGGR